MISPAHGHYTIRIAGRFSSPEASAASRNLPGAMLIDRMANPGDRADRHSTNLRDAGTEILSGVNETSHRYRCFPKLRAAIIRLRAFNDTFLYVARLLDPNVVAQLSQTESHRGGICRTRIPPARDSGELRAHVRGDRADHS